MNELMAKLQAEIQVVYASVNAINIKIMQTYNQFNKHESKYTKQLLDMRGEVEQLAQKFFLIANEFNKEYDPSRWEDMEI